MARSIRSVGLGILAVAAIAPPAPAETRYWTNDSGGNFSAAANWSAGGPPGSTDEAYFGIPSIYNVQLDIDAVNQKLTMGNGTNVRFTNATPGRTYTSSGGVNIDAARLTLESPTPLTLHWGAASNVINNSTLSIRAGNDLNAGYFVTGGVRGSGLVTVSGAGSTLDASELYTGSNRGTGSITYENGASGSVGEIKLGPLGADASGFLDVLSGSDLTVGGDVEIGIHGSGAGAGALSIVGSGSTYTLTNLTRLMTVGAVANTSGAVTVSEGAAMTTGALYINNTGTFAVHGGATVNNSGSVTTRGRILVSGGGSSFTQTNGGLSVGSSAGGVGTLQIDAGAVYTSASGHSAIIHPDGLVYIAGGTFNVSGDLRVDGGTFNNTSGGTFNLAAGRQMTLQNGGGAFMGDYFLPASASPAVPSLKVHAGGTYTGAALHIGNGSNSNAIVEGPGSNLTSNLTIIGGNGGAGALTIDNNATAFLGELGIVSVNASPGSVGVLTVQSGADVTSAHVSMGALGGPTGTGATLNVDGTGSTFVQLGDSRLSVGGFNGTTGTINLTNDANFESGSGLITVGPLGLINVDPGPGSFGTFRMNGDVTVDGGTIRRLSGFVSLANGKTINILNAGDLLAGDVGWLLNAHTINIAGNGSLMQLSGGGVTLSAGSALNVTAGGDYEADSLNSSGTSVPVTNTIMVDGAGSTVTTTATSHWAAAGAAIHNVSFQNDAVGSFDELKLADNGNAGAVNLSVLSGADLAATRMAAASGGPAGSISISVSGAGSTLELTSPFGSHVFGYSSGSSAILNVINGGIWTAAAGSTTTLNATAVVNITEGAVVLGNLAANGGAINFNSGSLSYRGNLTVGSGGLLGADLALPSNKSVSLSGTTTIDSGRTLTLSGGTLTTGDAVINGTVHLAGGTIGLTGGEDLTISAGGALIGDGPISGMVHNEGLVAPGSSAGVLKVNGNYAQASGARLHIELVSPTSFDQLLVAGSAALAGTLDVDLLNGFMPSAGASFNIFDFASSTGGFGSLLLPTLPSSLQWNSSQLYTTGVLSVVDAITYSADFDEDGDVDGDDLEQWQDDIGVNGFSDADDDGDSDGSDFLAWQRQLGSPKAVSASANTLTAVPEPCSMGLLLAAALLTARFLAPKRSSWESSGPTTAH